MEFTKSCLNCRLHNFDFDIIIGDISRKHWGVDLSISEKQEDRIEIHARCGAARIVVMDSGVSSKHDWGASICGGLTVKCGENGNYQIIPGKYEDDFGHGTAVTHSILKVSPAAQIIPIKIFDDFTETSFGRKIKGRGRMFFD